MNKNKKYRVSKKSVRFLIGDQIPNRPLFLDALYKESAMIKPMKNIQDEGLEPTLPLVRIYCNICIK